MTPRHAALAATAGMTSLTGAVPANDTLTRAQPVVEVFYSAVVACGRTPRFKPVISLASNDGATRYDPATRAIVLVPYEALNPGRRAAMDRFAAIGTLGLSGRDQYGEVFNTLLVGHELGHWVQEVARRPINRWQAEYEANRMMVAFWRDHPSQVATERRLANFIAQRPGASMPTDATMSIETYFNTNVATIEADPMRYSGFQKLMVRSAMAEAPKPSFCQTISAAWPGT